MKKRKIFCTILGHRLKFTGKVRDDAHNIGLFKCSRCGGVILSVVYPGYLKHCKRMKLYTKYDYKFKDRYETC